MVQSKEKNLNNLNLSIFDIPDNIIPEDKRIYYPDWDNKPPERKPILVINDKRVLTAGNYTALVSKAGIGKSSVCEAICSNNINPDCDSLGISIELSVNRNKILYLDTERTPQDTWLSWERTMKRANKSKPEIDKRIIYANIKAIAIQDRIQFAENILKANKDIGFVLFDGAGDFVTDVNLIEQTTKFTNWINSFNPFISELFTIHSNPDSDKPRGHLGSELVRRAESVFVLHKIKDNNDTRIITSNFEYGKVRNDNDNIDLYFKWSEQYKMFISAEYVQPEKKQQEQKEKYIELADKLFINITEISYNKLVSLIKNIRNVTPVRAKQIIKILIDYNLIKKAENGYYDKV